jgi:hypothetical protein
VGSIGSRRGIGFILSMRRKPDSNILVMQAAIMVTMANKTERATAER